MPMKALCFYSELRIAGGGVGFGKEIIRPGFTNKFTWEICVQMKRIYIQSFENIVLFYFIKALKTAIVVLVEK